MQQAVEGAAVEGGAVIAVGKATELISSALGNISAKVAEKAAAKKPVKPLPDEVLERVAGGAKDPGWKPSKSTKMPNVDASQFESELFELPPCERVAKVLEKAREVAKSKGWEKTSLSARNGGREIYFDNSSKQYYAVDTQHGRFEVCNKRGKHLGEVDIDLIPIPGKSADPTGGHDIFV